MPRRSVEKIIAMGNYPARVAATLDRAEALAGADVVLTTILAGGTDVWRHDIEIPKKYGVDTNVGDTRGPSGIFRFLRTINPMMDIVRDMEKYCPKAVLLNYTNPMAMLCGAMQRQSLHPHHRAVPLRARARRRCSAGGSARRLNEITYTCAGINHQAWYLDFKCNGEDAYPLIHKAISENEEIYDTELVRNEMYLALGYYVTESSGHNSRIQLVVPQAPGPDREILHPRHGLEPRRVCLHPEGISAQRGDVEGSGRGMVRRRDAPSTSSAAMSMPRTSSMR